MDEKFAIPGVGGIIIKSIDGIEYLLIQDRVKPGCEKERGLVEIPAGKIREYENIYDCLRREVMEETGLRIEKIEGENYSEVIENNGYKVLCYEPFSSSQNLSGYYPIMVQVFICFVNKNDNHLLMSNESKNIRWERADTIKEMLKNKEQFYPMHISTLERYFRRNEGMT